MRGPAVALLVVSALWGTTFVAVKSALEDSSPLLFVGVRFAVASCLAAPLLLRRRGAARTGSALRAGIPLGIVLALGYATQTLGLALTSPSRSALITGTNVALVPLWGALLLGGRPQPLSIAGLGVALAGLWLLTSPADQPWNLGDTWTAACAVFFALHVVLIQRAGSRHDLARLAVSQLVVTALLCLGAAVWLETMHWSFSRRLAISLAAAALLATAGTTWLQLRFQPLVDPTRAGLIYVTEPVFAAFFAWLVRGETLPAIGCAGGGLILLGMALSELGSRRPAPERQHRP